MADRNAALAVEFFLEALRTKGGEPFRDLVRTSTGLRGCEAEDCAVLFDHLVGSSSGRWSTTSRSRSSSGTSTAGAVLSLRSPQQSDSGGEPGRSIAVHEGRSPKRA